MVKRGTPILYPLLLLPMIILGSMHCATAFEHIGTIQEIDGDMAVLSTEGIERKGKTRGCLCVGDTLFTGKDTFVQGILLDGTVFTLGANSILSLKNVAYRVGHADESVLHADFYTGSCRFLTGRISRYNHEAFVLHTPLAVVHVQGTDFGLHIDTGHGSEEAVVLEGLLDFSRIKGPSQLIPLSGGHMAPRVPNTIVTVEIPEGTMQERQPTGKSQGEVPSGQSLHPTPPSAPGPAPGPAPAPGPGPAPAPDSPPLKITITHIDGTFRKPLVVVFPSTPPVPVGVGESLDLNPEDTPGQPRPGSPQDKAKMNPLEPKPLSPPSEFQGTFPGYDPDSTGGCVGGSGGEHDDEGPNSGAAEQEE